MKVSKFFTPVLLALAVVACSQESPTSSDGIRGPSLGLIAPPNGPPPGEQIVACKVGGEGTYDFTFNGVGSRADANVSGGFSLQPGECWNLGNFGGTGTTMSITETPRAGHEVVSIAVDQAVMADQFVTGTNTVTGVIGRGSPVRDAALVTFTNRVLPPPPPPVGDQGCTPGYWKNHPAAWTTYTTGQTAGSVFALGGYSSHASKTLLKSLDGGGGSGVSGALTILLRAATAGILDAEHAGVAYPRTAASIIADVNAAIASGNRDTILTLATAIDNDNNLGCPL